MTRQQMLVRAALHPLTLGLAAALLVAAAGQAQTATDSADIKKTAMNYIDGWYTGDADRMAQALHPELAKRMVMPGPKGGSYLSQMSAMTLIEGTRAGGGKDTPTDQRREDFRILDIYRGAAVAKVVAANWIDYLQLARWNGQWRIVNVLWELTPKGEHPAL